MKTSSKALSVLIGCEYSAEEREQFAARGHDAWSCDLLQSEKQGNHIVGDIFSAIESRTWDLIILHPPCTAMALCGNRWYGRNKPHYPKRVVAWNWTNQLWITAKMFSAMAVLEQPKTTLGRIIGKKTQSIQPWQFGHTEQKDTWPWLHNVPALRPTKNVYDEMMKLPKKERERVFYMSPGKDRGKERARAYPGIASAMAEQWGSFATASLTREAVPA